MYLFFPGQFATQSCFNGKFGEEIGSDQFGATVMLFGKFPDQDLVQGRIEYVEVTEAGQVNTFSPLYHTLMDTKLSSMCLCLV